MHKYCCQNMLQNYLDHIIPVPKDFNVNPDCLYGLSKAEFIIGLNELTDILKSIYLDMIQSPDEYGLPLVEDIECKPFNPKAADSKNSSHRLISLLHTLVQCGELVENQLVINKKLFSESKQKPLYKFTKVKMILDKLGDHGFMIEDFNKKAGSTEFSLSYLDSSYIIPVLYGYMKQTPLKKQALFSLNYFLAIKEEERPANNHQLIFSEYLSGSEQEFYLRLNEAVLAEGLIFGTSDDYSNISFRREYLINPKDKTRLIGCFSDFGKLKIFLRLRHVDHYADYIETLPERVKQIFQVESNCHFCQESCGYQNKWTLENKTYTMCGYQQYFEIVDYSIDDIKYYSEIVSKEVESSKVKRKKT